MGILRMSGGSFEPRAGCPRHGGHSDAAENGKLRRKSQTFCFGALSPCHIVMTVVSRLWHGPRAIIEIPAPKQKAVRQIKPFCSPALTLFPHRCSDGRFMACENRAPLRHTTYQSKMPAKAKAKKPAPAAKKPASARPLNTSTSSVRRRMATAR